MSTYKQRVRWEMLTNQSQSPLAGLPSVPVQDVRMSTDFHYFIFQHPNLTAAIARRDFQLAFVSNPKRYQKMHDLGFEGVRYSNGVQQWTFDFG